MTMKKLLIATGNRHKLQEIGDIFAACGLLSTAKAMEAEGL